MEKNPFESSKDKYSQYSIDKDFAAFLEEKSRYAEKLTRLLEEIRLAALGIDKQSQRELRNLERKVIDKLMVTKHEVEKVLKQHRLELKELKNQGKLFDV